MFRGNSVLQCLLFLEMIVCFNVFLIFFATSFHPVVSFSSLSLLFSLTFHSSQPPLFISAFKFLRWITAFTDGWRSTSLSVCIHHGTLRLPSGACYDLTVMKRMDAGWITGCQKWGGQANTKKITVVEAHQSHHISFDSVKMDGYTGMSKNVSKKQTFAQFN